MRRKAAAGWRFLLVVLPIGLSCDWRSLDNAVEKAPVKSIGRPGGYQGSDLGRVVIPLAPAPSEGAVAARLFAAGSDRASVAIADFDKSGKVKSQAATTSDLSEMESKSGAVKSAFSLGGGRVLIGSSNYHINDGSMVIPGRIFVLTIQPGAGGLEFHLTAGREIRDVHFFGLGVAAGNISGSTSVLDYVVLAEGAVTLLEDEDDGTMSKMPITIRTTDGKCGDLSLSKDTFPQVVVADLIDGIEGEEIAVGFPLMGGKVVVFAKGATGLECPLTIMAAPPAGTSTPKFGTSLVAGDVNMDGKKDLLVGAPPDRAYLYLGPFVANMAPAVKQTLSVPGAAQGDATGEFGQRVALVNVDGVAGPELIVAAPDLSVGSRAFAGQVFAFKADDQSTLVARVADNDPGSNGAYGLSLNEVEFKTGGCTPDVPLLVVGAHTEIFTYFKLRSGDAEPRCFAK